MKTRAKLYQMEPKASHQHRKRRKLTIPTLPDELITAILERLLVKYLLQFKCVSKNWFALISSPGFVKDHLSFSAKDYIHYVSLLPFRDSMKYCSVGSLFHDTVTETLDLDYPPMTKPYGDVYSSGCVNGLICLYNGFDGLVLWNPWIRKYKEVFGFRPTYLGCRIVDRLSSNGRLHWVTTGGGDGYGIMSIDLVDEKWVSVELPPCYKEGGLKFGGLGVLGHNLSMLCNNHQRSHSDVWVIKEYGR